MCERKPTCDVQIGREDDILTKLLAVFGIVGSLATLIGAVVKLTHPGLAGLGGAAAALAVLTTVAVFYHDRCFPKSGPVECTAGVINEIQESFSSASDWIFPFSAEHDRVDVVVKCKYWRLVETNSGFVKCAKDSRSSPILQNFFESKEVCGAERGALVGAGAGAIAGTVAGIAVASALCASPLILLCLIALLLAAIIGAALALAGAAVGGLIGKGIAGEGSPGSTEPGQILLVGHYVTTRGTLFSYGHFDGANVLWGVQSGAILHSDPSRFGEGPGGGSPYPHTDPDTHLPYDGCLVIPPG